MRMEDAPLLPGPTSPLVAPLLPSPPPPPHTHHHTPYPSPGFVYVFACLRYFCPGVSEAQWVFAAVYISTFSLVIASYALAAPKQMPPWTLLLLALSKRMHSLYILRLFNDCWVRTSTFFSGGSGVTSTVACGSVTCGSVACCSVACGSVACCSVVRGGRVACGC